jgi:hypothetical protein
MVCYNFIMHKLYELIIPSWAEASLYMVISLIILLILNASMLWNALLNSAGADQATSQSIDGGLRSLITSLTTLSDPQLVNAFVWGATAALGLFVAVAIGGFVRSTRERASDLKSRRGEISFVESLVVRLAALGGAILAALFVALVLLPVLSYVFVTNLTHLSEQWQSGLVAALAWLGVALAGYAVAVLCRLAALRVRIFSSTID